MIKNILTIGDSHIRVFESKIFKYLLPTKNFIVSYIPGATVYGILNKNSKTGAYNKIIEALEKNKYERIVITLGEVDTAYTLWVISKRDKVDINKVLEISLNRYKTFLKEISKYGKITVLSAPFSTIEDEMECDDTITGIRKKIDVPQNKRIELALRFNEEIKNFCKDFDNIEFIDFASLVLDKNNKVRKFLINKKKPCDHHYKRWVFALLIFWKLKWK